MRKEQKGLGPIGIAVRKDLGIIGQDGSTVDDQQLVALSNIPDGLFRRDSALSFLTGADREEAEITPQEIKFARLALSLYDQLHVKQREYYRNSNYGKATKIVGDVKVSPLGSQRRIVNFTTTNVAGEQDWSINATSYIFDLTLEQEDLSDTKRKRNLVVGETEEELTIIGSHEELYQAHGKNLLLVLQQAGYKQIGEIHAIDIDRFSGYFDKQ